jgi:hypothetical protein
MWFDTFADVAALTVSTVVVVDAMPSAVGGGIHMATVSGQHATVPSII